VEYLKSLTLVITEPERVLICSREECKYVLQVGRKHFSCHLRVKHSICKENRRGRRRASYCHGHAKRRQGCELYAFIIEIRMREVGLEMGRAGSGFMPHVTQPRGSGLARRCSPAQPRNPSGWVGFSPWAILGADSVGLSRLLS
jgi:hypothetical protein